MMMTMRTAAAFLALFSSAALFGSVLSKKHHIIHIIADDLGWADVGYHRVGAASSDVRTPNIDALATKEGLELDRFCEFACFFYILIHHFVTFSLTLFIYFRRAQNLLSVAVRISIGKGACPCERAKRRPRSSQP